MRRRNWVGIVAILGVLVLADVVYWRIVAERVRAGYEAWVVTQISEGWEVKSGPVSIGGWPVSAGITIPTLMLRHAGVPIAGDVNVAFAGLSLSVPLFDPTMLSLSPTGPIHVKVGNQPDVIILGDRATALIPLLQDRGLSIALHANQLRLEAATGAWHATIGLLNGQVQIAATAPPRSSEPTAVFVLTSEAIALPAGVNWPLGTNISSLTVDGRVTGPLPKAGDIGHWATAWRNGGGALDIAHLTMGWGPLGLALSATLGLDDSLQPMGSGNARVVGYADTLDRLAAAGMLTKSAALAAKAVLSLMAATSDLNESATVDVPLTLQSRTLSMHQVPLIRLPEVDWAAR